MTTNRTTGEPADNPMLDVHDEETFVMGVEMRVNEAGIISQRPTRLALSTATQQGAPVETLVGTMSPRLAVN